MSKFSRQVEAFELGLQTGATNMLIAFKVSQEERGEPVSKELTDAINLGAKRDEHALWYLHQGSFARWWHRHRCLEYHR